MVMVMVMVVVMLEVVLVLTMCPGVVLLWCGVRVLGSGAATGCLACVGLAASSTAALSISRLCQVTSRSVLLPARPRPGHREQL